MNWDDARLFLAVARAGQMLGASRRLGVNQSTLSRRLTALERDVGAQLLRRSAGGSELTDAGRRFLAELEAAESGMLAAQDAVQAQGDRLTGSVRVGAPDGFGVAFLAPRLGDLHERHPDLAVQLVPVPRAFSLSEREADIAIMVERPTSGRLVTRKLTDYTLGLYASPGYLDRHGAPVEAADLAGHTLVGYVGDLIYSPSLDYAGEIWRGWRSHIEISSAIGQFEAVRSGVGIGILHDFLARGSDLVPVLPGKRLTRAYWTVFHESSRGIARIRAVADFLAEAVESERSGFTV